MRPSFTMSAAAVIALTAATSPRVAHAFRANASGVLARSLSHLVGGGAKTCDAPNKDGSSDNKPAFDTSRTVVKRGLFSKLFGGMSEGIDYSTLKGMAAKEAADLALKGEVKPTSKDGYAIGTFAGGCFWGLELAYQRVPGVIDTSVGYTQGKEDKPTYDYVCSGFSGHTEAVQVFYDPKEVSFEALCQVLFSRIDPTLKNQVGNDRGTQYRHGIYFHTPEQEAAAKAVMAKVQEKCSRPIVTECMPAAVYWPAEEYHQKYLSKGGRFNSPQSAEKGCTDTIRCYG